MYANFESNVSRTCIIINPYRTICERSIEVFKVVTLQSEDDILTIFPLYLRVNAEVIKQVYMWDFVHFLFGIGKGTTKPAYIMHTFCS